MKTTIVTLACLFVLCVSIANSLQILAPTQVLATTNTNTNNLQILTTNGSLPALLYNLSANLPLEAFGSSNSSEPQGLWPTDIKTVYNLPSTGGNDRIAIIDPYHDPTIWNDLYNYSTTFNLPFDASNFDNVTIDVPAGQNISTNVNWTSEISLDVEWAHAMAPNAKILLVEAFNNSAGCLLDAVDYARNQPDVVAISMSWGFDESAIEHALENAGYNETILDPLFTGSNGTSFFAGSGDLGENVSWPACSPNVVGVGGTKLNFYSNGSLASETVWKDASGKTGGGVSAYEAEPSYQASYGVQGSNGHRSVPDVSFDAGTGVAVFCTSPTQYGTNWLPPIGGTSLGTPCWAAICALNRTASNSRLYPIAKSLYNSASFRDITNGTNGNYNATTGYDFCTGLGSPLTSAFVSLLPGDIRLDGTVDIYDAIILSGVFNTKNGDSRFNPFADLNGDLKVDIYDAIILSNNFLKTYSTGRGASKQPSSGETLVEGGASVAVNPSQTTVFKGEVFTVNVDLTSVTDLLGWQFTLYWNSTILNCTNYVVQTPTEWQDNNQTYGNGLEATYNATHSRFLIAETANYPAPSFNGSMTLATLTFQAMQPGTTSLTLTDTKLGNSTADPIDHTESSGSVTVYYGRYMRSDTQQVNGLSAYKLNIPQSASYALNTQSGSGMGASWGIRAWVRHSNGVEQEISLDGQTGTPTATVGGGSAGIRSNTVSVAQTTLQSTDSLVIRVYLQIADGPWNICAAFTTEQLQSSMLKATVWTVYYYTSSTYNRITDRTTAKFYWGTTTYNSRIQNLQYS